VVGINGRKRMDGSEWTEGRWDYDLVRDRLAESAERSGMRIGGVCSGHYCGYCSDGGMVFVSVLEVGEVLS